MAGRGGGGKRIDPADGCAYTMQEFKAEYGGLSEWNNAKPANPAGRGRGGAGSGPEKRKDTDGCLYTKQEFQKQYGGYAEWDAAAGGSRGGGGGEELRLSPANNKPYPKSMFLKHFGGTDEWDAATPARAGARVGGHRAEPYNSRPYFSEATIQKRKVAAKEGRRVIVGNLKYEVRWQDLKDHFKSLGEVVQADVFMDGNRSKGTGVVEFKDAAVAKKAIDTMRDTEIQGRKIWVRGDKDA